MTPDEAHAKVLALPQSCRSEPKTLFAELLSDYASNRIDDTVLSDDGDMLLFQWGTFDFGAGPTAQINLTRQFIVRAGDSPDDQQMIKLACTFHYPPTAFGSVTEGSRWCRSPDELDEFSSFVFSSPALAFASYQPARDAEVTYGPI